MKNFLGLIDYVLTRGTRTKNRTGVDTISVFAPEVQFRHDLADRYPLVTVKRTPFKPILEELLWFLSGSTNAKDLDAKGVKIWNANAHPETGELGPIYSKQWRAWQTSVEPPTYEQMRDLACDMSVNSTGTTDDNFGFIESFMSGFEGKKIDQIAGIVKDLKTNPDSRRIILNSWNVGDIDKMRLPPCHVMAQFRSLEDFGFCDTCGDKLTSKLCTACGATSDHNSIRRLSCMMTQRSADLFLGVPFNIASYALLTRMLAEVTGHYMGELVVSYGDLHLYAADDGDSRDQVANAKELLKREPKPLPLLRVNHKDFIDDFRSGDFELLGYEAHPALKSEMVV